MPFPPRRCFLKLLRVRPRPRRKRDDAERLRAGQISSRLVPFAQRNGSSTAKLLNSTLGRTDDGITMWRTAASRQIRHFALRATSSPNRGRDLPPQVFL
jgi:hypothetical protein